jgi:hypothetical protein
MAVGMSRQERPKATHQVGICGPDLGPFAHPLAICQPVQGNTAPAIPERIAQDAQTRLKIRPTGRLRDICGGARPNGREKLLFGPSGPFGGAGVQPKCFFEACGGFLGKLR